MSLTHRTPAYVAAAASLAVALAGCAPPLNDCELNGFPGLVLDLYPCPADCYVDLDGDGWGGDLGDLDMDGVCDDGEVTKGNDCNDADAGSFPGNVEVCDGLDNDCNGEPDFDVEGEEDEGTDTFVFSCTPNDVPIQLFLLGGSQVVGQALDATTSDIKITAGQPLDGRIRLRVIVPAGNEQSVAGGLAVSWADSNQNSFFAFWRPVEEPDGQPDAGYTDYEFEISDLEAPQAADDVSHYITLAAGLAPDAPYIGSLTDPFYCYPPGGGGPGEEPCPPSWDGLDLPGGGPQADPDRDVADLDELDLAGCRSFGAARLPVLIEAVDTTGQPCSLEESGPGQNCIPFYAPVSMGCTSIKMVIEEADE